MTTLPTADGVIGHMDTLSNWGRLGEDDRLDTVNLITPDVRGKAASLIQTGSVISLSRDIDPDKPDLIGAGTGFTQRFMRIGEVSYQGVPRCRGCTLPPEAGKHGLLAGRPPRLQPSRSRALLGSGASGVRPAVRHLGAGSGWEPSPHLHH
jgi:hypothetical protein